MTETRTPTRARDDLVALGREVAGPRRPKRERPRRERPERAGSTGDAAARLRARWIVLAAALVAVVLAIWIIAFSSLLAAAHVRVSGVHRLSTAQVLDRAGVRSGTPLVRLPRGAIQRRVEQLPDVLSASVSVSFPSTVVIKVVERTASGVLEVGAGKWALVDETGHQFNTVTARPAGLPVLAPATTTAGQPATLAAMAQVAVSLPSTLLAAVSRVSATAPDDVTLTMTDGHIIDWGPSAQNAEKAKLLPTLLAQGGQMINLVDPLRPYLRSN